ncbi:GNAT family N-acetyltransferase [Gorillibacterium timonense]|uniref:GNAT family N-acetyltransferase n=1 Tax=Gorillibacterium timonense TaxID=1689269 RepID=UPI00071D38A1|nr:GNAT family N-acetyltransferase [Gorillibacterium timonense]
MTPNLDQQTSLDIHIRSEKPEDYPDINQVNLLAFDYRPYTGEGILVSTLRARTTYTPDLSLVAVHEGQIVGHALFTPLSMRIDGSDVPAVLLAPLAVHPTYQRKGIGSRLVKEGHRRASSIGASFSFLLGHPTYYPRLGYSTHMFGKQLWRIARNDLPISSSVELTEKKVREVELPELMTMWETWYGSADFVRKPEARLADWVSTTPRVCSVTLWKQEELIGYLRYPKEHPEQVSVFLAKDEECAMQMLSRLTAELDPQVTHLELTLPAGDLPLLPLPGESVNERWDAAMICRFDQEDHALKRYMEEVKADRRKPGPVIWPPEFDGDM